MSKRVAKNWNFNSPPVEGWQMVQAPADGVVVSESKGKADGAKTTPSFQRKGISESVEDNPAAFNSTPPQEGNK